MSSSQPKPKRGQLNIKFSPEELEALRRAKEESGRSYRDLLLEGARVSSNPKSKFFDKERLGSLDIEARTPGGAGVKVKRTPPERGSFREASEEDDGSERTEEIESKESLIRPEVAEALQEQTPYFGRTDLEAATKTIGEKHGLKWADLSDAEKQAILTELDGLPEDKTIDSLSATAENLDVPAEDLAGYKEEAGDKCCLVDLTREQPTPAVWDALKDGGILPFFDLRDLPERCKEIGQKLSWDQMTDADRAHILSLTNRQDKNLTEIAELLGTDEETLRIFRTRIVKTGNNSLNLRPERRIQPTTSFKGSA